jgi:hypothetical protein
MLGRNLFWCVVATALCLLPGITTTASADQPAPAQSKEYQLTAAGSTVTRLVSPRRQFRIIIPGVGTLSGPRKAVTRRGRIIVRPYTTQLSGGLYAAGTGVDVSFKRTRLRRALTLTQRANVVPGAPVPVVAHRGGDGRWDIAAGKLVNGRRSIRLVTKRFSFQVPAWLNPREWARAVGDRLAASIGGRTSPWPCPVAPPAWFDVINRSSTVHACATANNDAAGERGEVRIKSNRGAVQQVTLAGSRDYAWVDGQPNALRSLLGKVTGTDPAGTVFLSPGDDGMMTVGYRRPAATTTYSMLAETTYPSLSLNTAYFIIDQVAGGVSSPVKRAATAYLLSKCSGSLDLSHGVARNPLDALKGLVFTDVLSCLVEQAAAELTNNPNKAFGAALDLVEPSKLSTKQYTEQLISTGRSLQALGKVLFLRPLLQQGWQGAADTIAALVTSGGSTHIDISLKARTAAPGTPAGQTPRPGPPPPTPPPPVERVVVVYNQVTNGATAMREDTPAYLSTVTANFCKSNGCALPGTDMGTGAYITAMCQTTGNRTTNGQDNSAVDDRNPGLYTSTRWYGIRWADGRTGYLSEVWIAPQYRGGMGLRAC